MKKIIIQFITSFIFSLLYGGFGLFLGTFIGNTFNFPPLLGMRGYESGGAFFMLIGITLGGLFGFWVIIKKFNEKPKIITLLLISIFSLLFNFFLYGPDIEIAKLILVLIIPALLFSLASYYKFI